MNLMNSEERSVLLSFVIGARNDEYMGDFRWRLATTLNYLARNLARIGKLQKVEVMVCDWGSEVPISGALELTREAREITHFVRVSPQIAQVAQKDSPFPVSIVQNVAIRRARGKYIAQTDAEILFTASALTQLFALLENGKCLDISIKRALCVASRRHVPVSFAARKPNLEQIDRYLALHGTMLKLDRLFVGYCTPSALALMHRSIWEECEGYDERLIYWGWMDIDLYLRITQRYPWLDLANFGVLVYHLEHYPNNDRSQLTRKANPIPVPRKFRASGARWGLSDQTLPVESARPRPDKPEGLSMNPLSVLAPAKTPMEILAGMQSPEVVRHVEKVAQKAPADPRERAALCALAWYSLRFPPERYLEFGIRYAHAAAVVVSACPSVEIYGVDSWDPVPGALNLTSNYCAETINRSGHDGYCRFVTGDPLTAFARLRDSFIGDFKLDLVFFRGEMFGNEALPQIRQILHHLSPGGLLIISCDSSERFTALWSELGRETSLAAQLQISVTTGLLFGSSVRFQFDREVSLGFAGTIAEQAALSPPQATSRNVAIEPGDGIAKLRRRQTVPVVIIHAGFSSFLNPIIEQALEFNSNVILIGDESSKGLSGKLSHESLSRFSRHAHYFEKIYTHLSSNSPGFERFCIQRWFVLKEFMEGRGIEVCFAMDSDVLLYVDAHQEFGEKFNQFDLALTGGSAGTAFLTGKAISEFCDYVRKAYERKESVEFRDLARVHEECVAQQRPGGVSDMTLWQHYMRLKKDKMGNLCHVNGNSAYDSNITMSEGYEMIGPIKKVLFENGIPYVRHLELDRYIKFNCLHFQGVTKPVLADFVDLRQKSLMR